MDYKRLFVIASNLLDLAEQNGGDLDSICHEAGMTVKEFNTIKECDLTEVENIATEVKDIIKELENARALLEEAQKLMEEF